MTDSDKIEKRFDKFFSNINYRRVAGLLFTTKNIKNADYISTEKKFIVELKVIENNFFDNGGFIERFRAIVLPNKEIYEKGGITTISIPNENREGAIDNFEEPMRRILKKANRQLRETNIIVADNKGVGILVIVLTTETVKPELYVEMVYALLSEEFNSIQGFILTTAYATIKDKNTNKYHPYCFVRWPANQEIYVINELKRLGNLIYSYFSEIK